MLEFSKYFFPIFFWSRAAGLLTRRTRRVIPRQVARKQYSKFQQKRSKRKLVLDFLFRTFSVQLSIRTTK